MSALYRKKVGPLLKRLANPASYGENLMQLSEDAEQAGMVADRAGAIEALTVLLTHKSAVVREGAIYGLTPHLEYYVEQLRQMSEQDPSPGIRDAAAEALEVLK